MTNVGTGSPIFARQNPQVYLILLLAAIVVVIFVLIFLTFKALKKLQASSAWQEANRKKRTTFSHIKKLSQKMHLTALDENLLWNACRRQKSNNILYIAKDMEQLDRIFCSEYVYMRQNQRSEDAIYSIFVLRKKFEAVCSVATRLKTTMAMKPGLVIYINNSSSMKQPLEIAENTKSGLLLFLPPNMQDTTSRPVELSKMMFSIPQDAGGLYTFFSRIVRYTTSKDGKPEVLISHTNEVDYQERRKQKRIEYDCSCDFSAVKVQKQNTQTIYIPQQTRYSARMKDISAGGCRLLSDMPIKEGQHIHIKFLLSEQEKEVVGVIVRTTKGAESGTYFLAVKFVQITQRLRNEILARVYNYS